jgi:hypothetical protein
MVRRVAEGAGKFAVGIEFDTQPVHRVLPTIGINPDGAE